MLIDDELDEAPTRTGHRIEEYAEKLGDLVESCEQWHQILGTVFPGLYADRKLSEKTMMYYTTNDPRRITRYGKRAWQGVSVFNPGDSDGSTQETADAQAKARRHSPAKAEAKGLEAERPSARLLRELEEVAAIAFGAATALPEVPED